MSVQTVLVPLAKGFEEVEAVTIIDILRRAKLNVIVAGVGMISVEGAHGITIRTDTMIENVKEKDVQAIVLPGGMPGTTNLKESPDVGRLVKTLAVRGAYVCAICAAPTVLEHHGILVDKKATCYPAMREQLKSAKVCDDRVAIDDLVVTSQGVGTALEFSLKLVELWKGKEKAAELAKAVVAGFEV